MRGGDGAVESEGWDLQTALRGLPRATGYCVYTDVGLKGW